MEHVKSTGKILKTGSAGEALLKISSSKSHVRRGKMDTDSHGDAAATPGDKYSCCSKNLQSEIGV